MTGDINFHDFYTTEHFSSIIASILFPVVILLMLFIENIIIGVNS